MYFDRWIFECWPQDMYFRVVENDVQSSDVECFGFVW